MNHQQDHYRSPAVTLVEPFNPTPPGFMRMTVDCCGLKLTLLMKIEKEPKT